MEQNIIIAGVFRAGKSTISNMISKKYGYQHVIMDSINEGFEKVFPELGINTKAKIDDIERLCNISAKIAPFINAMMESGRYNEFEPGMVLDVYELLPIDYIKYINKKFCKIYYFLTEDITAEERFKIFREYDTEKHYTYFLNDEDLLEFCNRLIKENQYIKKQCIKYNLPYYETSKDRNKVFKNILQSLSNNNLNDKHGRKYHE
jgi:2-phosphoglycerate kinase